MVCYQFDNIFFNGLRNGELGSESVQIRNKLASQIRIRNSDYGSADPNL